MKLNVWKRTGIVASALWFLGGGLYQRIHDTNAAGNAMGAYYRLCTAANPNGDFAKCMADATGVYKTALTDSWGDALAMAIIPVLLGWLLTYIAIWTVRWVMAGRRPA